MNTHALCPCCSSILIHHINGHRDYWFCRTCWSEMPVISAINKNTEEEDYHQPASKKTINHDKNILNLS